MTVPEKSEFDAGLDWATREILVLGNDPIKMKEQLSGHWARTMFDRGALLAIELLNPDGYQRESE